MMGVAENLNVGVTLKFRCSFLKTVDQVHNSCVGRNDFFKQSDCLATLSLRCGNFILTATLFMKKYHVKSMWQKLCKKRKNIKCLYMCRSAQSLLSVLEGGAVSGENEAQVGVVQLTVDELIKKVVSPTNISFSGSAYLTTMMDVFNRVNLDPTFQGRSLLARSMSTLAYGILEDRPCSSGPVILIRNSFYLLADKVPPASLAGRRFNASRDGDFLQLPRTMVLNTQVRREFVCVFVCTSDVTLLILFQASCVSIHYIEFLNGSLYLQPTFMAKVRRLTGAS